MCNCSYEPSHDRRTCGCSCHRPWGYLPATTTEASTEPVQSHTTVTIVMGDDATITAAHFTDHPTIGSFQLDLNGTSVYLTDAQAHALYHRLGDAIIAATAVSA